MKHYKDIHGPHLVIVPKSTLANWCNEIKRWVPSLTAICLIGNQDERNEIIRNHLANPSKHDWDILVTSYEMVSDFSISSDFEAKQTKTGSLSTIR